MIELCNCMCCGIRELHGSGKSTARQCIKEFCELTISAGPGQISTFAACFFTQASSSLAPNDYGDKLSAFILKNRLGDVGTFPIGRNPNTGNNITVYVWKIDWLALLMWRKDNLP